MLRKDGQKEGRIVALLYDPFATSLGGDNYGHFSKTIYQTPLGKLGWLYFTLPINKEENFCMLFDEFSVMVERFLGRSFYHNKLQCIYI